MSILPTPSNEINSNEIYSKLFNDGKLIQLHIRKWSMTAPIFPNDLNIEPNDLFRLGVKKLIKTSVMHEFINLEGRARRYLDQNAFDFPIAQAHFIPNNVVLKVLMKLDEFRSEFLKLAESFISSYSDFKKEMLEEYPEYKDILSPCYPPVDDIQNRFGFNYQIFEISIPKKLKEISIASIHAEKEAIADLKVKYSAKMEEQFKAGVEKMDTFLDGVVSSLRGKIISSFEHVIDRIRNRQSISQGNISTLKDVIQSFRELNFIGDHEVNDRLNEIYSLLESNYDFKEDAQAIEVLNHSLTRAVTVARDVTSSVSRTYRRLLR